MQASQPCDLCGCTEVNLHDGFYFCVECGTQDTNFQETIVEIVEAGGEILHGNKKKVVKIAEETKEMSDEWYKSHAFNFLLKGTADELLQYGANPSFKTKLLWVWSKYIKKYLKSENFGLNENPDNTTPEVESESDSDEDEPPEVLLSKWDTLRNKFVKSYSFTLLVSLIYVALNLDKSVITLTHLIKLFKDGLLSVPYRIEEIVPKEMKPEKLRSKIKKGLATFKVNKIRIIGMTLFKRLDLGNPVVPDLRLIIDNHLKELCLPTDLKPLVLSLMHYKSCGFLDVNAKDLIVYKIPAYEFQVMTYILWAMKLCLGLDCEYEVRLSDAVETINEKEELPRSHFVNGESEPTERLFSFREWVTFYQFKQILLRHYCYRYANKCSWDTDDYIALEHHMDLLGSVWEKDLRDEMAYNIINKIRGGEVESDVIPRSEFKPSLTPYHSYTQVIAQHLRDPEVKLKLTEDFSQYSLNYVIKDWQLAHPNSKSRRNLVKGIRVNNKIVTNKCASFYKQNKHSKKMVYVRDCDNHNWLTTKPPTLEHVVGVDKLPENENDVNDKDINGTLNGLEKSNNGLEKSIPDGVSIEHRTQGGINSKCHSISEISGANSSISDRILFEEDIENLDATKKDKLRKMNDSISSNSNFPDIVSDYSFTNSTLSNSVIFMDETKVFNSGKLDESEKNKLRQINDKITNPFEIREETEGVNIFDDDFKPEIKEELEEYSDCGMNNNELNVSDSFQDVPRNNSEVNRGNGSVSEGSSLDSVNFNEGEFDRAKVIKEIIIHMCKKHKLPIPAEYNPKLLQMKEMGLFAKKIAFVSKVKQIRNMTYEKERRGKWKKYVDDYYAAMQDDVLNQIAQKVHFAIQNAEDTQQVNEQNPPIDESMGDANAVENMEVDDLSNNSDANINESELASGVRSQVNESDEDRLFSDESDGETHAKELLPEKNPDFDEEVYDASQLYIKAAKTAAEGEMELDPQLSEIIDKKMVKDAKDPTLLTWKEERKKLPRPDSEDEMPLSVLQELQELRRKLSKQEHETLKPFVRYRIENFHYWFRFYMYNCSAVGRKNFEKHGLDALPKSFSFLLRQCSLILGVPESDLYKNLQNFEMAAVEKLNLHIKKHASTFRMLYA